jgi:hypothetical protein
MTKDPKAPKYVSAFHIFHKWSKWEILSEFQLTDRSGSGVGLCIRQRRECLVCDLVKVRQQRILLNP